jgi:hypothetical protein
MIVVRGPRKCKQKTGNSMTFSDDGVKRRSPLLLATLLLLTRKSARNQEGFFGEAGP